MPTHVEIDANKHKFDRDSVVLLEQIRTIDKQRLTDKITHLDDNMMKKKSTRHLKLASDYAICSSYIVVKPTCPPKSVFLSPNYVKMCDKIKKITQHFRDLMIYYEKHT